MQISDAIKYRQGCWGIEMFKTHELPSVFEKVPTGH